MSEHISKTFKLYAKLQAEGRILRDNAKIYYQDDTVRGLLTEFAKEVDCGLISDHDYLYMIPLTANLTSI